jgi:hypothetical protein
MDTKQLIFDLFKLKWDKLGHTPPKGLIFATFKFQAEEALLGDNSRSILVVSTGKSPFSKGKFDYSSQLSVQKRLEDLKLGYSFSSETKSMVTLSMNRVG